MRTSAFPSVRLGAPADCSRTDIALPSADTNWLDALDLDPLSSWLAMGTRSLGNQPWLIIDDKCEQELALRRELIEQCPGEVLASADTASAAVDELVAMVSSAGIELREAPSHGSPLARLGCSVTEDLLLLRRGSVEWEFEAGVLCFPSRWRLSDKIGQPLRAVHGPTPGYDPTLADRITSLLDRLGDRIVRRRNWFVHPDPALFQPDRPTFEPLVPVDRVFDELYLRSERQTLRSLPATGRVLFTVKTQQCSVGEWIADPTRRERATRYFVEAPMEQTSHRGVSGEQREILVEALTRPADQPER